ncbi:MAG: DUF4279 domain-containing protein [Chloroflexi bacterium]|nr:DUF4279 domain-containing protein [Chloroflexota bacterium]
MDESSSRLTPIDDSNGSCILARASLCIYPDEVDPATVTKRLGLEPTYSQKKGEQRLERSGRLHTLGVSSWLIDSDGAVSSRDLRRHLDWLLDRIEPAAAQLRELQQCPGVEMSVRCAWFAARQEAVPTLWPEQMRRLAALNLECLISIGYYGDDEDQQR